MDFHFSEPQTDYEKLIGGYFYINATGKIKAGDDKKFGDFLTRTTPPPRLVVYINSSGGDVEAAIGIGRLIRDHWFSTSVGSYMLSNLPTTVPLVHRDSVKGQCMSAATLAFLGGRLRFLPDASVFGVHQFSLKDPSPENAKLSQQLSAKIAVFVNEMGISPEFMEMSTKVTSDEIYEASSEELVAMKVTTGGQTETDWSVQARGGAMYVRGERDSIYGHHKVLLSYMRGVGFIFHAVIEAQGREEELTGFGLIEIVVDGEAKRIDISGRCDRKVIGIYVNIIAKITDAEAQVLAFSESFGVQVRFSAEADMFLGIAAMDTNGGKEQLEAFFCNLCTDKSLISKVLDPTR